MADYEYLFSVALHTKLKSKIKGKVWVKVFKNTLVVRINHMDDVNYEYILNNFSDRVLNGLGSDYIVYEVLQDYKQFVMSQYFY